MSKKSIQNPVDHFVNALTTDQRVVFDDLVTRLNSGSESEAEIRGLFFQFAAPMASDLGIHPGQLWGALKKQHQPKPEAVQLLPFADLANSLPYPLGYKLNALLQAEVRIQDGEREPQFAFEMCSVMGLLVRMAAMIAIQAYVKSGKTDASLNHTIMDKIRAPSDGGWLELAQRLSKALKDSDTPFAQRVSEGLTSKPKVEADLKKLAKVSTAQAALSGLIKFRNDLVHGETISDARLQQALAQLKVAVRGFSWLASYDLRVSHRGTHWVLSGQVPKPTEDSMDLPEDEPCLVHPDQNEDQLSLSPLLQFVPGDSDTAHDVDFDELFFLNAGSLERLSYIGYRSAQPMGGKALGTYEAFKSFIAQIPTPPIPKDARIDFSEFASYHSRLFVGREPLLEELAGYVSSGEHQYVVMRALAGMGKSAVFANLLQASINLAADEADRVKAAADGLVRPQDKWAFHFCMPTDGRNSPTVALRSLIAQICDHFDLERDDWLSQDVDQLKDEKFPALLAKVGPLMTDGGRLVVVIDALDEGIGAEKESVPSCIPAGTYENVVFLLSFRVDSENENSRVQEQLRHLAADRLVAVEHANPLAGLTEDDAHLYLERLVEAYGADQPTDATRDAVWAAASRNAIEGKSDGADPFYLRFFADGVQQGNIRLDRAETVPESLDDAFEDMWMGLPTDRDFLCHRLLLTLGIMREYGDDELFAALFNRERSADDRLVPDDVAAVRINAGKLLVYDGDRYGLFHDRFRVFLVGEQKDPIADALGMG